MPERKKYRCNNCGERFEVDVLSKEEEREYDRQNRPYSPVHCPKCNRTDIRKGWS